MATKKQIIMPIVILIGGVLTMVGLSSLKKPPEEKEVVDNTPIVAVETIALTPMNLDVKSYGIVKPKYETQLVAQVTGQIVELSETFVRGGFVKKGQLLARIDPSDYQAALIDAQATLASAKASLQTEMAQGKVAETEWQRITDASPTDLSLRKPQLAQELARVKAAQASILRAERNLQRTEIIAPYNAMIDSRTIGLGSFVTTGSQIGKLLATAIAEVRLPVADNQLQFLVDQGKNAKVILHGNFAGQKVQWQAHIARDEGVVDDKSRMSYLVAQVDDPYHLSTKATAQTTAEKTLRFGSYVNAKIQGISLSLAASIPRYLVNEGKVALLGSDLTLHYTAVNIIREEGANVIIGAGLANGDKLIISALDYPVDGMKLALMSDKKDDKPVSDELDKKSTESTQVASVGN
ncbi:MAG: efflux RND transporter periplasmic adaptor subunit [Alteromonadaceae bacterium]|nr:efflux RND transporter periplasmic adaptor subunit [Alteromonadaceae bacterium]